MKHKVPGNYEFNGHTVTIALDRSVLGWRIYVVRAATGVTIAACSTRQGPGVLENDIEERVKGSPLTSRADGWQAPAPQNRGRER